MPKATITAVVNQKGGTAKTTTSENLGFGLAREGKRVLLVDTDPQASLTIALGNPQPDNLEVTLTDLMKRSLTRNPSLPVKEFSIILKAWIWFPPASSSPVWRYRW